MILFSGLELNGMNSVEMPDIPPPLPLKGTMADYGYFMESQESISPATSPPVPQRVSFFSRHLNNVYSATTFMVLSHGG